MSTCMSSSYFQGGDFVELLSAQGKAPATNWKLQGKIAKSFEKLIKGNAFLLDGSTDTRMQLPKVATGASMSLGLTQRYLVLQLLLPFTKNFSIEIGFADLQRARRRFVISSAFREPTVTALHAQIPLGGATISRDTWINLVLDLQALTDAFFAGSIFRSMESLAICGCCRLKRVFTMKDPPAPSGGGAVMPSTVDIPKQFAFSCGNNPTPAKIEYFIASKPEAALAIQTRPPSDCANTKASNTTAKSSKEQVSGVSTKKAVPTRKIGTAGVTSTRRIGSAVNTRTVKTPASRRNLENVSPKAPKNPRALEESQLSSFGITETPNNKRSELEHRGENRFLPTAATTHSLQHQHELVDVEAAGPDMSNTPPASIDQLSTAQSMRTGILSESATEFQLPDGSDSPQPRPITSRISTASRNEIINEIQERLSILSNEDEREQERNHELFIRHTTLARDASSPLNDSSVIFPPSTLSASREPTGICKAFPNQSTPTARKKNRCASIFAFHVDSVEKTDIIRVSTNYGEREASEDHTTTPFGNSITNTNRSKLFDFESLLDPVGSETVHTNTSADDSNRDSQVNSDYNSDDELEQLLAAKREARRNKLQHSLQEFCDPSIIEKSPSVSSSTQSQSVTHLNLHNNHLSLLTKHEEEPAGKFTAKLPDSQSVNEAGFVDCVDQAGGSAGKNEIHTSSDTGLSVDEAQELILLASTRPISKGYFSAPRQGLHSPPIYKSPQLPIGDDDDTEIERVLDVSSSFDFGELVELEDPVQTVNDRAHLVETSQSLDRETGIPCSSVGATTLLSPLSASFNFDDLTGGEADTPEAATTPKCGVDSSSSKRLQRLLESTEWQSLPRSGTGEHATPLKERSELTRLSASSLATVVKGIDEAKTTAAASLELVYDPVLRCYYDPVSGKYYALAK